MKKLILLTFTIFASSTFLFSQNQIKGKVDTWKGPSAPIVDIDMMTGEASELGRIDENGAFAIPLIEDYLKTLEPTEAQKLKMAEKGWQMKDRTVESTYVCSSGLEYEGKETVLGSLPDMFTIADVPNKKMYGSLIAASGKDFADWYRTYGQKNATQGYTLSWLFADGNAKAKGKCTMETYTGNDEEKYEQVTEIDIQLREGWNIVKYSIEDTFKDVNGRLHAKHIKQTVIATMPEDATWLFIARK